MNTTDKIQVSDSTAGTSTSTTASQWQTYNDYKAERGWECPRCGRINAPWVRQCDCSRSNWTITPDWTYKPDQWKTYVTCQQEDDVTNNPNIYQVGGSDYKVNGTYVNVGGTQSNKVNPNSVTTAWNNGPSTNTIHNGNTNAKEEQKKESSTPQRIFSKYIKEK